MKKKLTGVALVLAAVSLMGIQPAGACTRAVYLGPDRMVVTGRTMDWKEDIMSNIYVFPRGMQRAGHNKEKTVNWTSKYGSVIATGYDIGTCDGMNEKGLVASLLFLPESVGRTGTHTPKCPASLPAMCRCSRTRTACRNPSIRTRCAPAAARSPSPSP